MVTTVGCRNKQQPYCTGQCTALGYPRTVVARTLNLGHPRRGARLPLSPRKGVWKTKIGCRISWKENQFNSQVRRPCATKSQPKCGTGNQPSCQETNSTIKLDGHAQLNHNSNVEQTSSWRPASPTSFTSYNTFSFSEFLLLFLSKESALLIWKRTINFNQSNSTKHS